MSIRGSASDRVKPWLGHEEKTLRWKGEVDRPLNPPNRRIRDPYVRWCGRRGAARLPPIPIRRTGEEESQSAESIVTSVAIERGPRSTTC